MTDPEDISLTYKIAEEQRQAMQVAQQIQRGQIVGNLGEIPTSITFQGTPDSNVRYLVIVRARNGQTGERVDTPIEILSDAPILKDDVIRQAREKVIQVLVPDKYKAQLGEAFSMRIERVTIISVSRR